MNPGYSNNGSQIEVSQKNVTVDLDTSTNHEQIFAPGTTELKWGMGKLAVAEATIVNISELDTNSLEVVSGTHPITIKIKDGAESGLRHAIDIRLSVRQPNGSTQPLDIDNVVRVIPDPSASDSQD